MSPLNWNKILVILCTLPRRYSMTMPTNEFMKRNFFGIVINRLIVVVALQKITFKHCDIIWNSPCNYNMQVTEKKR